MATLQANNKKKDLLAAFEEEMAVLGNYVTAQKEAESNYENNTTAGILDLDANEDPVRHGIANTFARACAALSKTAGQVATTVEDFAREGVSSHVIPQEVRDARSRHLMGEATPADLVCISNGGQQSH